MKRGTPDHPKTLRLMEELQCSKVVAVGVLELLWHFTSTYAPRGDIGRFTAVQIAKAIGWDGDPTDLVLKLTSCRWLDRYRRNGLLVHDWPEHADDAVHMSLARRGVRFATGAVPSMRRFSEPERKKLEALFRAHGVRTKSAPPLPLPEPTRTPPLPPAAAPAVRDFHNPPPANGNGQPPTPPARAGGSLRNERREAKARIEDQVEQARLFAISARRGWSRPAKRRVQGWFTAGAKLADVQQLIEHEEHLARSKL